MFFLSIPFIMKNSEKICYNSVKKVLLCALSGGIMNGKEFGLTQPQYMFALWSVRAYIAGYKQPYTNIIDQMLLSFPVGVRSKVLSDIQDRVNVSKSDTEIKTWRDKLILSLVY